MRARHVLGLARRVDAVTKLGRSASPRWSCVRALPHVAGRGCPGLAVARPPWPHRMELLLSPAPPRAAMKPLPAPSPRRRIRALLPCLALPLPTLPRHRAALLTLPLPSRARGLSRLRSHHRLDLMALRPRRACPHLPPYTPTWSSHMSRSECAGIVASPANR